MILSGSSYSNLSYSEDGDPPIVGPTYSDADYLAFDLTIATIDCCDFEFSSCCTHELFISRNTELEQSIVREVVYEVEA